MADTRDEKLRALVERWRSETSALDHPFDLPIRDCADELSAILNESEEAAPVAGIPYVTDMNANEAVTLPRFLAANFLRSTDVPRFKRILEAALAAPQPPAVAWINHCDRQAISALRYLAYNDRQMAGSGSFNTEHLLQIAEELERSIAAAPRAYGSEILVDGLDNDALFALVKAGHREGDETIRETPEVAALRARVAELEAMVGWRAIADEPAPRDGSWVAMACADDAEPYIEVGHWSRWESMPEYVHIGGGLYRREPVFREDWSGINNAHRATHWMPVRLPTPPEPSP